MSTDTTPTHAMRKLLPAVAFAAAVVLAIAVPILVAHHDNGRAGDDATTPEAAVDTVRGLVDAALVQGDGESACVRLTPTERERVGAVGGVDTSCRATFDEDVGALAAGSIPRSPRALRDLPAHVAPDGDGYRVVLRLGSADLPFVVVPATAVQRDEFDAPGGVWRVDDGAAALVAPPHR